MTTHEELRGQGYEFFCFTTPEDRLAFCLCSDPDWTCVGVDETFMGRFTVYFLAVRKVHRPTRAERGCYV